VSRTQWWAQVMLLSNTAQDEVADVDIGDVYQFL